MAVAIMVEVAGLTAAHYDALMKEVWPDGHPPKGAQLHVAGPGEGVWRVVDVWDAPESFDAFAKATLGPAMQKAGVTAAPKITIWPVHNMVNPH